MKIRAYQRSTELDFTDKAAQKLDAELTAIFDYCATQGWQIAELVEDVGGSWGEDLRVRPRGAAMLQQLAEGDVVVVHSLERLFSSCYDAVATLQQFLSRGISLHVVILGGDVVGSDRQFPLLAAAKLFAALERQRSTQRIRSVKQVQRSKGRYLGGSRPFGYMIHTNGRLIEHPMEQRVLKRIKQLREQGKSLRAIAAEVSTPVAPISFKTVQRILQRHV